MAGDYTRFTFDPIDAFSGVHKQQGRVSLDSDFNEFEEILDRQSRAEMYDIVGEAVVPLTTPSGFQIGINGLGELTIGVGRAYVDGILTECFGDLSDPTATVRDDHLGGIDGPGPVAYDKQPFFYQPGYPTLSPNVDVINLVYLDVWQREVTVFENDDLREPALNGPDTATRVQTAWQVKVLADADASSCSTPPASWAALTAPSTARMSALATPAAPVAGPCVINPAGGYTGLENRLYRVEIHRAGTLTGAGGTTQAQFKWSRDNASLAARVLSITAVSATESIIMVTSTGRDSWMRFEPGHHLELIDDYVEFAMRETGIGGSIARVLAVNHATGEIRVDQNLAAFAIVPVHHPRIRRWDIASAAEPLARDTNNGTAIALEDGITVTFGAADSDTVHAGDFWVFAARTADGSIDTLVNAPPRGILHHFARLALVTSGSPPTLLSDCRIFWPRDTGCCTVVVRPGQSIQGAINSLPPAGGCVCLKAGIHPITAAIAIDRSNVHFHGESEGAEIHSPGLNETLVIRSATGEPIHDVMVGHLRILVDGERQSAGVVIRVEYSQRVAIRDVEVVITSPRAGLPDPYVGLYLQRCADIVFANNVLDNVMFGAIVGNVSERMWITDNAVTGPLSRRPVFTASAGIVGVQLGSEVPGDHRVERNTIRHFRTCVDVQAGSQGATVSENRIFRSDGGSEGKVPFTVVDLRFYLDQRAYAIELSGGRCIADGNYIELDSAEWGGIRVRTPGAVVSSNVIIGNVERGEALMPPAIYCTLNSASGLSGSGSTIRENRLQGPQTGIVISRVFRVSVSGNRVDGVARGWFGVRVDDCQFTTVEGTLVSAVGFGISLSEGDHNVVRDGRTVLALAGVTSLGETDLTVSGNEITAGVFGGLLLHVVGGDALIARNRVVNCGWLPIGSVQGAIFAISSQLAEPATTSLRIESCEIIEAGIAPDGSFGPGPVRGIHAWFANCQIVANRVVSTNPKFAALNVEHRAVLLIGPLSFSTLVIGTSSVVAANNVFRGPGRLHLVDIPTIDLLVLGSFSAGFWFHKIAFSGNFCDHSSTNSDASTVLLGGQHVAASANQVTAPRGVASIDCFGCEHSSIVGNVTSGQIRNVGLTPVINGVNTKIP